MGRICVWGCKYFDERFVGVDTIFWEGIVITKIYKFLVCRFGHKEFKLENELVIDEVKKVKLIFGKSIDLSLNKGGIIFNFHNIKSHFLKNFYIIKYNISLQNLIDFWKIMKKADDFFNHQLLLFNRL